MQSLYLLFLVAIIILVMFPFTFNLELFYDLNLNKGYYFNKIWKINLQKADLKRKGKDIVLIKKRKKEELEVPIDQEQLKFLKTFFDEVKNKFKIRKLTVDSKIGLQNPFHSAMISSVYSSIILAFFARLKTKQPTATFELNNNTDFFEFIFNIKIYFRVSISIFDLIYTLLISILKNNKDKLIEKRLKKI